MFCFLFWACFGCCLEGRNQSVLVEEVVKEIGKETLGKLVWEDYWDGVEFVGSNENPITRKMRCKANVSF